MIQNKLHDEYVEWMYHLIGPNDRNKLSYRKLIYFLDSVAFVPILGMDENRWIDGIYFRYRFGFENGIDDDTIKRYLDTKECSVLEMMVAMAFRVEESIMDNSNYGNRTGQWFWVMIVSLGLGQMDDTRFNEAKCKEVVDTFLARKYSPDGRGGLFTLREPKRDMRDVDIWCQFMWYLSENEKG